MFDLEAEILRWRRRMISGGIANAEVLRELESHLREHVAQQVRAGVEPRAAFESGVQRLGEPTRLGREFARAEGFANFANLVARLRQGWLVIAVSLLAGLGVFAWQARVTPLYRGTASVVVQGLAASALGNDVRAAQAFNTSVKLLTSQRVRSKVAASVTPQEQKQLAAAAAGALVVAAPDRDRVDAGKVHETHTVREHPISPFGQLLVRIQRLSFVVEVSVDHPHAGAAALLANRYIEAWQAELAQSQNPSGASLRVIDAATPPTRPISPNYRSIAFAALAIAVCTFVGLTVIVFLLGKLMSLHADRASLATS